MHVVGGIILSLQINDFTFFCGFIPLICFISPLISTHCSPQPILFLNPALLPLCLSIEKADGINPAGKKSASFINEWLQINQKYIERGVVHADHLFHSVHHFFSLLASSFCFIKSTREPNTQLFTKQLGTQIESTVQEAFNIFHILCGSKI